MPGALNHGLLSTFPHVVGSVVADAEVRRQSPSPALRRCLRWSHLEVLPSSAGTEFLLCLCQGVEVTVWAFRYQQQFLAGVCGFGVARVYVDVAAFALVCFGPRCYSACVVEFSVMIVDSFALALVIVVVSGVVCASDRSYRRGSRSPMW